MNVTTRTSRKSALKKDVKCVLEELWDAEEEELFYKIFTIECQKGTQKVLRHSKSDIQDISCRDDDGNVHCL